MTLAQLRDWHNTQYKAFARDAAKLDESATIIKSKGLNDVASQAHRTTEFHRQATNMLRSIERSVRIEALKSKGGTK